MPELLGINHLTLATPDLDRLVATYTDLLGAVLAFERAATPSDPRIAVVGVGGVDIRAHRPRPASSGSPAA